MNNDMSSYFEDQEFKNILAKYEGMVESHTPTYFDAEELTDIAEYYAYINEEEKADKAIELALQLHPANTDALIFKSRSFAIKGNLEEAYRVADLIEDTSDREVKFLKADLLIEENHIDKAEEILEELAESEEESFEVLLDITMTYMDANQKDYAAKWLKKIRQKGFNETNNQTFRDAWCDFCMTFGEPEKAVKAFQLSLDELPYSIKHWIGLAKCYLAQLDSTKAHEAIDFALAIDEKNEEALEVKGFCHLQSENYQSAIDLFKQLLKSTQNKSRVYALIAKSYIELEMTQDALNTCLEWFKQCSNLTDYEKSEIYSYIAMCYSHLNNPIEGMKYIDAAINLNPFYRGFILQKGMIYLQTGEKESASNTFQKALALSPDDEQMEVMYSIANCYLYQKEYKETIEWCCKIISDYPNDKLEALIISASVYYELGNTEQCLYHLSQAWKINNHTFDDNILTDRRFYNMFSNMDKLLDKFKE